MAKFSRAEMSAYESGKGYAVAMSKKGINFKKPGLKQSFANGFKKGLAMLRHSPEKYPNLKRKSKKKS